MRYTAALILWVAVLAFSASALAAMRAALVLEHDEPSTYTELLRKGLDHGARKFGVDAEIIIAPKDRDQLQIFRNAAVDHDLVLVASDAMHEILRDNAGNFRRVKFGVIDASVMAPNVMSVTFADEQAAFIAGAMAATAAARKNPPQPIIGWLSGEDVPAMRSLFNGYREGALLEQPGCRVVQAVVGSFADKDTASQKMQWLIDSGASVIALAAGAGNENARKVAQGTDVELIDLNIPSGQPALGTITKAVDRAVIEILAAANGQFRGKNIVTYDLSNGGVDFLPRSDLDKGRLSELRHELKNGGIKLHSLRQRTLCDCLD